MRTQRQLFWQAAALVPGTALIVLVFVSLLARPIRQIDQAISELGRGTFSRQVVVQGPSDLERLGRQLEWLRVRLLDLAQEKNRFLRHMSHELKTPLANIREGTELLMEGAVGDLDANQREVVGILRENGIKLQRLIENLLSFSAWQAKSVGLELSEFPLRPLIKQVVEAQQLTLVANRVRLDIKVQDVAVIGFSTSTSTPASRKTRAVSKCAGVGVAMVTQSTRPSRGSWPDSTRVPRRSANARALASSRSTTTRRGSFCLGSG